MALPKRLERERSILTELRGLICEQGFFDLKISELAKRCELSVGTLYSHFACKEDLLMALAIEGVTLRLEQTRAAVQLGNTALERLLLVNIAGWRYGRDNASLMEMEFLAMSPSIWRRASRPLHKELRELNGQVGRFYAELIDSAVEECNLDMSADERRQLLVGTYSLVLGSDVISISDIDEDVLGSGQCEAVQAENLQRLLAGWGWPRCEAAQLIEKLSTLIT